LFCLRNSPILAKTTPSFYFLIALAACPTTVTNSDNRDHKWGLKTVLWVGGFWVGKGGTGPMTKRTARWAINPNWLKWLGRPAIGILCHCPAVSVAFRISLHRELVYAKMLKKSDTKPMIMILLKCLKYLQRRKTKSPSIWPYPAAFCSLANIYQREWRKPHGFQFGYISY